MVVNSTSIQVEWQPPNQLYQNGLIQHFIVTVVHVLSQNNITVQTEGTEVVISSLHPSYSYELIVAAVTIERGPFSVAVPFTMLEDGRKQFQGCCM